MYDTSYKILLLSGPGVDKSGLTPRILTEFYVPDLKLTIGVDFKKKILVFDNKKVLLKVWDFSDEERFKFLLPRIAYGANGAIFIYNITKETSVDELHNWINATKNQIKLKENATFPIVVLGNKPNSVDKHQIYPQESIAIGKLVGVNQFIECSIRTGDNVEKAFETLTRLILAESEYSLEKTKKWDDIFFNSYPIN